MRRTIELDPTPTGGALRREVSARNRLRAAAHGHELTYGNVPAVLYAEDEQGNHGNFYPPAYRRITAHPEWNERLHKAYTASARVAYSDARQRRELDTACSSDALLMSIFCAPGTLRSARLQALLQVGRDGRCSFGVRTRVPLLGGYDDRTEADMELLSTDDRLLVEAKLTESGFQQARPALLLRYPAFADVFDTGRLPRNGRGEYVSYQLLRSVLAAECLNCRFALFVDARRPDLQEQAFRVFAAVENAALRNRLHLVTWQEIATCVSRPLQAFLCEKYGIAAA